MWQINYGEKCICFHIQNMKSSFSTRFFYCTNRNEGLNNRVSWTSLPFESSKYHTYSIKIAICSACLLREEREVGFSG